jgi:hypothetical protein
MPDGLGVGASRKGETALRGAMRSNIIAPDEAGKTQRRSMRVIPTTVATRVTVSI